MCLVAVAAAAPQYNYQQGGNTGSSLGFSSGLSSGGLGFGGSGSGSGFSGQALNFGGAGGSLSSYGGQGGSSGGFGSGAGFSSGSSQNYAPIVTKQFYLHAAPEENDNDGIQKTVSLGPAHKNYRVVFIKAPHSSAKSSSVRFTAPQNEEKTVIYVLSKKTDASDIQTNIDAAQSVPSKPEVFFIKYRTPEEADHAQRQIQGKTNQCL